MGKMSDLAKKAVSITRGLERIKIEDLIERYPEGVSINGVDYVKYEDSYFPVFTFEENPGATFSGGMALRQIADIWLETFDGDVSRVNEELRQDPCRVKLKKTKMKNGRTFTGVQIIDADAPEECPI